MLVVGPTSPINPLCTDRPSNPLAQAILIYLKIQSVREVDELPLRSTPFSASRLPIGPANILPFSLLTLATLGQPFVALYLAKSS